MICVPIYRYFELENSNLEEFLSKMTLHRAPRANYSLLYSIYFICLFHLYFYLLYFIGTILFIVTFKSYPKDEHWFSWGEINGARKKCVQGR